MMFKWIKTLVTRNPCKECDYYHKTNKTCHSKKCCTGRYGYVTFWDRLWCEPYKGGAKTNEEVEHD